MRACKNKKRKFRKQRSSRTRYFPLTASRAVRTWQALLFVGESTAEMTTRMQDETLICISNLTLELGDELLLLVRSCDVNIRMLLPPVQQDFDLTI